MTTDSQPQRIVFAIIYVWHGNTAQNGCEESTWCSQTVDAEGIVTTVLRCPFGMINLARRQYVLVNIGKNV